MLLIASVLISSFYSNPNNKDLEVSGLGRNIHFPFHHGKPTYSSW
jgi:hypothetical protein